MAVAVPYEMTSTEEFREFMGEWYTLTTAFLVRGDGFFTVYMPVLCQPIEAREGRPELTLCTIHYHKYTVYDSRGKRGGYVNDNTLVQQITSMLGQGATVTAYELKDLYVLLAGFDVKILSSGLECSFPGGTIETSDYIVHILAMEWWDFWIGDAIRYEIVVEHVSGLKAAEELLEALESHPAETVFRHLRGVCGKPLYLKAKCAGLIEAEE